MYIIPNVHQGTNNAKTPSHTRLGDVAVSKHLPKKQFDLSRERRNGLERRIALELPMLDLRAGRDRRATQKSIDTNA